MSTLKVNALNNNGSAIDLPNSFKIGGNPIEQGYTSSATEPTSPNIGDLWWDSANEKLYQYLNGEFKELSLVSSGGWYGNRALLGAGYYSTNLYSIDYHDLATTSANASDFGDLSISDSGGSSLSDATYGVFNSYITIEYVTIATPSNATDFGDAILNAASKAGSSNGTTGLFSGGNYSNTKYNTIDYITIATPGNASDFGDLTVGRVGVAGFADATYSVIAAGYSSSNTNTNVIDYVTIATPSNATDFGDTTSAKRLLAQGSSDETRGFIAGGYSTTSLNVIEYVTIATPSNATDFGDLVDTSATEQNAQTNNATISALYNANSLGYDKWQYWSMATAGNASSATGLLVEGRAFGTACSGNA